MIRRQLARISAVPSELAEMAYRDLIREAAAAGLIVDPESFFALPGHPEHHRPYIR